MGDFLRSDDLWRIMVRTKIDQTELKPEYIPPEGMPGQGGTDADTELRGFKRDFDVVMERIMELFPDGISKQEFADYLTRLAHQQKSNSAGPYIAATLLEVRAVVMPDYVDTSPAIKAAAATPGDGVAASRVIEKLRQTGDSYDQEVLDIVSKKLKGNATAGDLKAALGDLVREYSVHEDYFAEVASGLKSKTDRTSEALLKEPAIAPRVAAPAFRR